VREVIKLAGERWLGPHATLAELMRRRRLGTIVAGSLFAAVSLALATTLILTTGIVSVSLATASPRLIVRAALVDGLMVLAISMVAASVYWAWRELAVPTPGLEEEEARPA